MNQKASFSIALLHYPVYNKKGEVVTTAVTNLDIHDIARTGRTYGARRFFIITPLEIQRDFVHRILAHWRQGYGASYNPARKEAFDIVRVQPSLEAARNAIAVESGQHPRLVATSAQEKQGNISFRDLRTAMLEEAGEWLLLFGTGWGIAEDVLGKCDFLLEPIRGTAGYNHLSVRSAVSIVMDRLAGA
ncbi:MAG TPA: RNA methyltransferase [Deltaproteobacteria bacterium]|nr:RNA methyltransferase [Deltaproteobacteria bacterium]